MVPVEDTPIVEVKEAAPAKPARLVIEGGIARPDRRGHSPISHLLSGASMKAKANGVLYRHEQVCERIETGVATLAYAMGLVGVAMSPKERWSSRGAYVIGIASAELEQREAAR